MGISDNVRSLRLERGWSLEAFAKRMEIAVQDAEQMENGQRVITSKEIQLMCKLFDVTIEELFAERQDYADDEGSVLMPIEDLQNLLGKMKD